MEGDGGDWELSKENIQPLRHGRAMSSLQAALAPQCQENLRQIRREFEEELRTTSGVSLLDVYHRYVLWVEQHHVTGGHGVNLRQLLEQAIVQFKTNTELFNDERYVGIWIRYAEQSPEPLAVLKAMFETDIGVRQAQFYATWAQQLEASGDTRGASRVLQGGIDRRAEPTSLLEGALRHLEARVSRQVALDVQQQGQEAAVGGARQDPRPVLAPLRPQGRHATAPVMRTGPTARPAEQQQGGLAIVSAGSAVGNRGHTKVRVRADENAPPDNAALLMQPVAAPPFAPTTQQTKENSRSAGPWSGVTAKQRLQLVSAQPGFEVLEEQGSEPLPCTPALIPGSRQALSERKKSADVYNGNRFDCWEVPLCRPDPPDLPTRPMYDKASVYRGTTEFQFEEIRMAKIRIRERRLLEQRLEAQRHRCAQMELERLQRQEREQSERDQQVEALKCEVLQLRQELQKMRSMLAKTRSGTRDHAVMTSRMVNLEQSILVAEQSILVSPSLGNALKDRALGQPEEAPPGTPSVHQAGGAASAESTQSGTSLRTADVSNVVRSLWNCTLAQSRLDQPSLSQQDRTVEAAAAAAAASNAEDEAQTETTLEGAVVGVAATPFEVFCEPTHTGGLSCSAQPPPTGALIDGVNDENRRPADCGPPEPPVWAEPLEQRVPFAELHMQEDQAVDDDEDVLQGIKPLEDEDNFTYAVSKSFARKVTSTPCATDRTVPQVGEDFTVGGLTALVQGVAICEPSPRASSTAFAQPCLVEPLLQPLQQVPQELCNSEHQQPCPPAVQPAVEFPPGPDTGNSLPLAKRRFSVAAAAGDLSTILECSKEGKSSSNSGGSSCSSSSSQHSVGVATLSTTTGRPPTGGSSTLPAVQEEPDDSCGGVSMATPAPQEQQQQRGEGVEQAASPVGCKDPFSEETRCSILTLWQPQQSDQEQLLESSGKRPVLKEDAQITLGGQEVKVLHHLASGAYARVYLALILNTEETYLDDDESFEAPSQMKVVLKADNSRTNAYWETYIYCELRRRFNEALSGAPASCVVDLQLACFFNNGAILVFPYSPYGTLLDLVRRYQKQGHRCIPECLVLYFALELITTLQQVHLCGIIHADVKPDNVVITDLPSKAGFLDRFTEQGTRCLQLIDFGRAIDMSQLPPGTTFTNTVTTDGFVCTEMRDGRPWTFQTDWFGLLGCLHVLLFGDYMEIEKMPTGAWSIRHKFKRYWQQDLWNRLFSTLLNIPSCSILPDLAPFALEIQSLLRNRSRAHDVVVEALRAKNI
ncbi:mitotic checkpoint serine/threonine-protein kinase BUB1-like isoform X3 [Dermacentor albipictus]|uniref:mitotic checkpoint serine/threonine-protein kinase BUB1-like isoform X3 n=1 Tax=Dermacentor albipictus TaxID=60249 RepID=UPI0038FD0EB7